MFFMKSIKIYELRVATNRPKEKKINRLAKNFGNKCYLDGSPFQSQSCIGRDLGRARRVKIRPYKQLHR